MTATTSQMAQSHKVSFSEMTDTLEFRPQLLHQRLSSNTSANTSTIPEPPQPFSSAPVTQSQSENCSL